MILLSTIGNDDKLAEKLIIQHALPADIQHASRRKNPIAQRNSLLARAVLRNLLSVNHDAKAEIIISESGKPYIKNGPHISISHSKNMVACAVSNDFMIGVDIENHKKRDFKKLAEYAFGPNEIKAVNEKDETEFYRIWTMREAIAKAEGKSIFNDMNGKDIDIYIWSLFHESPQSDYTLTVAAKTNMPLEDMIKRAVLKA